MSQALKELALGLGHDLDDTINDDAEGYLYAQALQILNDGNQSPLDQYHIVDITEVNRKEFIHGN